MTYMDRTIGECFYQIQNGANIKQGNANGGYPITRIETIANDKFNRDRMGYAGINDILKYESYILEDGDLLMSHINSVQYLGRTVLYEKIEEETIIHGMNLLRLRARSDIINPSYARYCFYGHLFRSQIANITKKSVNQASFAIQDLKQIKIDVPEVGLQKQIVEILNKISWIIEKRKQELDTFDELIRARFVEMFGDPQINYFGWNIVNISDIIGGKVSNGFFAKRDDYVEDGNVGVIGVSNIVNRMYSKVDELPRTNANENDIEKFEVKYGDILFCRSSLVAEGIGKASIIPEDVKKNILFECHVIRLPLDLSKCVPEFIQVLSTTDYFRNQIITQSKTATMTTIGQDGILKTNIILPPMARQIMFYDFIRQVNKSKVEVQRALDEAQLLFDSLMQKYFG